VSNTEATEVEPDKNLCRDVCAERVRRVMQGYSNQKSEQIEGLVGNFAYLKTRRIAADTLLTDIQHSQIKEIHETSELPKQIDASELINRASLNSYGFMPSGLNETEKKFAHLLELILSIGGIEMKTGNRILWVLYYRIATVIFQILLLVLIIECKAKAYY
jgi:hypothetical protein